MSEIDEIKLDPVHGSTYCQFSIIENDLEKLYKNQEKLLQAIRLIYHKKDKRTITKKK